MYYIPSSIFWQIYTRRMGGFRMETPGSPFKTIRSITPYLIIFPMAKLTKYFLVLLLFSCQDKGKKVQMQNNDLLAGRFHLIDGKLLEFASRHKAKLSTVWAKSQRHDTDRSDLFLVRHIVWSDGRFDKAVMIAPHNDLNGVDTNVWDFSILAWLENTQLVANPSYENFLVNRVEFRVIEKNIDQLLSRSEKNLMQVKVEDLK